MRRSIFKGAKVSAALCTGALLMSFDAMSGQSVPVPRIVIYSGSIIDDASLEQRDIALGREPERTWHMDRSSLVGRVARRTLLPGQAIPIVAVKLPDLVKAGKPVTLVFSAGPLTITGNATALQAGSAGDRISLQNPESGAVIRGVVTPDGSVRVGD
jgi:flagella basal body P-ring formation protein FlgA